MSFTSDALDAMKALRKAQRSTDTKEFLGRLIGHMERAQIFHLPDNGITLPSEMKVP